MPLWYQNYYIWSHVWDVCEVTVILVNSIIMRSQCCHSMMSHMHKMTTSPWGRSVGTVWCHRYWRWPQHHEVTVLSQDNAHHVRVIMMSLCFRNYDITSQWYKLTASPWAHMQCCQRTMLTMWGHFDVPMISKLWHHMCELFVRSCWYKLTASPWGHSVVTGWCPPCEAILMSLWYRNYDITYVSCLWGHGDTSWPHHHEVKVLSQDDAHHVRLFWCLYDIKIMTSHMWVVCEVMVIQVDRITMRSKCCHRMMLTMWGYFDVPMISKLWHQMCELFVRSCWYKLTVSPWGHRMMLTMLGHFDVTMISKLWHHICELFVRSCGYKLTASPWGHRMMLTMLGHFDVPMKSKLCHHICELFVRSCWYKLTASPWGHRMMLTMLGHFDVPMISKLWHQMCELFVRSCWYKLTASPWGHRMMLTMLGHFGVPMISKLWHHICELFVRSQWLTTNWPHHHDVVVLSQYDISDTQDDHITMRRSQCCHSVMSQIHGDDRITMRSQCCHSGDVTDK